MSPTPAEIAKKTELYPEEYRRRQHPFFGAEAEFFIFDNVSFDQTHHSRLLLHRRRRRSLEFRPREG